MSRKRRPNAEQQGHDQRAINACIVIIDGIASRYPERVILAMALRLLTEFGNTPLEQPKPRVRKPKAAQVKVEFHGFADGKSAAANDTRELAHHSV